MGGKTNKKNNQEESASVIKELRDVIEGLQLQLKDLRDQNAQLLLLVTNKPVEKDGSESITSAGSIPSASPMKPCALVQESGAVKNEKGNAIPRSSKMKTQIRPFIW